jgi:hypothetical protein
MQNTGHINQLFSLGLIPDELNYFSKDYSLCMKKIPHNRPEIHERLVERTRSNRFRRVLIQHLLGDELKAYDEKTRNLKLVLSDEINNLEWVV